MIRSRRSTLRIRPIQYNMTAPPTEPIVDATTTPNIDNSDLVVINPPKVKMTSDGIGGIHSQLILIRLYQNSQTVPLHLLSNSPLIDSFKLFSIIYYRIT